MRGVEAILPDVPILAGAADEVVASALANRVKAGFRGIAGQMSDAVVALAASAGAADRGTWAAGEVLCSTGVWVWGVGGKGVGLVSGVWLWWLWVRGVGEVAVGMGCGCGSSLYPCLCVWRSLPAV